MQFPDLRHKQAGITLIELSVALIVIGIFMAFALDSYVRASAQKRVRVTEERLRIIMSALSDYAQTYSRLPCPSDPRSPDSPVGVQNVLGWEIGVNAAALNPGAPSRPVGSCQNNVGAPPEYIGVVPFMTLNIPYEVMNDGWGRAFTYVVMPILTLNNSGRVGDTHVTTRTAGWIQGGQNINNPKARFCGLVNANVAPPLPPLAVGAWDGANIARTFAVNPIINPAEFAPIDTRLDRIAPFPPGIPTVVPFDQRDNNMAVAVVIISHGPNGTGAFRVNGTAGKFTGGGFPVEGANWNDNQWLTDSQQGRMPGLFYYDDIVMWHTTDGVMAYNGKSSCALP